MKIYDYILKNEKIQDYNKSQENSARYIVETDIVEEFIVPKSFVKGFFAEKSAKKYFESHLKKEGKNYYLIPTKFDFGIHCSFLEKSRLNDAINRLKELNFVWVTPYYFAMEIIEERKYKSGKLYINIGEYIYKVEIIDFEIISYHSHLKDGYYSKDMRKVNFFNKSIIWVEDEKDGFVENSKAN